MTTITIRSDNDTMTTMRANVQYNEHNQSGRCLISPRQHGRARRALNCYRLPTVGQDNQGRNVMIDVASR